MSAYQNWLDQIAGATCAAHHNPKGACLECQPSLRTAVAASVVQKTRAEWDKYFANLASQNEGAPAPPDLSERIRAARVAGVTAVSANEATARQAAAFAPEPAGTVSVSVSVRPSHVQVASGTVVPDAPDLASRLTGGA